MSIMAESNIYETIADDGLNEQLCLAAASENSNAFMFIPKIERNVEEVMDNVEEETEEEIIDGKTAILNDGIIHDTYSCIERSPVYYEETYSACEEVEVDYKPSLSSTMIDAGKAQDDWHGNEQFETSTMNTSVNENPENISMYHEEPENVVDSDEEETIATFLTSAGQRLALYAVEDSDEVFAVAVYDESGDPPTNFQFLMKSDVERLIGEGAVRTVKKPTQMKKQMLSTDHHPPVFAHHVEQEPIVEEIQLKPEIVETTEYQKNRYDDTHKPISTNDYTNLSSTETILPDSERKSSPLPGPDPKQPEDFNYVLMEDAPPLDGMQAKYDVVPPASAELDRSGEFIEQSTVQYILLNNDSEGDLTLADVEETLKNNNRSSKKSLLKKPLNTHNVDTPEDHHSLNFVSVPDVIPEEQPNVNIPTITENTTKSDIDVPSNNKSYKNPKPPRKIWNSLICRRDKFIDDRFKVSSGTSLLITNSEAKNLAQPSVSCAEPAQIRPRVKRSRKQQLTSVNRDDSEIIIQPASFPTSEDDEPTRKRGRGKRKLTRPTTYKTKAVAKKKITKIERRLRAVEIIEIDVDEGDRLQGKNAIVEITIDDNKEKGSSDKENEVIMVGDSEDEEVQEAATSNKTSTTILLTCVHCLRSFRQKRALKTHSRVCPKSSNNVRRINEKKAARRNTTRTNDSPAVKKEYACKICQEKFDVVVALARHVRSMHSQKKKINTVSQTPVKVPETPSKNKDTTRKSTRDDSTSVNPRRKIRTKINASNRSWKSQKLHCLDCGKWFSSDALLTAHSLQHATKKSEKQTRRCQTCKKIFKTRLLYIRHMKMHNIAKQLQKKLHHTRQVAGITTAVRKRGRPRKL